jgi:hypothetical protein
VNLWSSCAVDCQAGSVRGTPFAEAIFLLRVRETGDMGR